MPPKPLHLARKVLSGGKLNKANQWDGRAALTRNFRPLGTGQQCKLILTIYVYGRDVRLTAGARPLAKKGVVTCACS